jgi:hypothetical protein
MVGSHLVRCDLRVRRAFARASGSEFIGSSGRTPSRKQDALRNLFKLLIQRSFFYPNWRDSFARKDVFPTSAEIRLQKKIDPGFPWHNAIARLGAKASLIKRVGDFCKSREDYADLVPLLSELSAASNPIKKSSASEVINGSVYLIKSGRHYKIGFTNDLGRRKYDLRIQLPERVQLIHEISTDDPKGIEQYWHRRFADQRANGEWFSLTPEDVAAFKRRKFM